MSLIDDARPFTAEAGEQVMSEDDDITKRYHRGNPYSIAAHDGIKHKKANDFFRILTVLHKHPHGMICEEVEIELGMKHQTCSARFTEMKKFGWIIWCGERLTRSKKPAGVWRVAPPTAGLPLFDRRVSL